MTSLYNRRGPLTIGEQMLYEARAKGRSLSVVFIDLDGLKDINDGHGHRAGDNAFRAVAKLLRGTARDSDVVARIGGDEFCIVIPTSEVGIDPLGERLNRAFDDLNASGLEYEFSVSVGAVSVDPRTPGSLEDMLTGADAAMYERKRRLR